jgi:hypothetical protein
MSYRVIVTGMRVDLLSQLPPARAVLCDITPQSSCTWRLEGSQAAVEDQRQHGLLSHAPIYDKLPMDWKSEAVAKALEAHIV